MATIGRAIGRNAPSIADLSAYDVNRAGMAEGIYQPVYDYQPYPAAGALAINFFQSALAGRSLAATNLQGAGQFPAPQEFLCVAVGVTFRSGLTISAYGAGAAATQAADAYAVLKGGSLRFTIGDKDYLRQGALMEMPPAGKLQGFAAASDTSTAGAAQAFKTAYAMSSGPMFQITPIRIPSNQNFNVRVEYPALVPLPSTDANAEMGVILYGFLYRLSQ